MNGLKHVAGALVFGSLLGGCFLPKLRIDQDASDVAPDTETGIRDASVGSDAWESGARDSSIELPDATRDEATRDGGTCSAGTACTPAPCQTGETICTDDGPKCRRGNDVASGTMCGTGKVCKDGACVACAPGTDCSDALSCQKKTVDCSSGSPVCKPAGNAPNGAPCGNNLYCNQGACSPCAPMAPCDPTGQPCHVGSMSCAQGVATCNDTTTKAADGAPCGTNMVCRAGACAACTPGLTCTPTNPCHKGTTSCSTGQSTCVDNGENLTNGTACGTNQVCSSGVCGVCTAGTTCTPSNVCHKGATSCSTGTSTCIDNGQSVANGTTCGTDQVCNGGNCAACTAGGPCTPQNACHKGLTSCTTGQSMCADNGQSVANGTTCGNNQVCNGGNCGACTAGSSCTPQNACHKGLTSCTTGQSTCVDNGQSVGNGTACGTNKVCSGGNCVACTASVACTPGNNPCHHGVTSCATGQQTCTDTGIGNEGQTCGNGGHCSLGSCCIAGETNCGNGCIDPIVDPVNCGGCNHTCSVSAGATADCREGKCVEVQDPDGEQCQGSYGGVGDWDGCRGSGCWVCRERIAEYPLYRFNHPSCIINDTCDSQYYRCSANCPAPSGADACNGTEGNWDGCRGTGCWVCRELVAGYSRYFLHHPFCIPNDLCDGAYGTCNSHCPPPSEVDR